MLLRAAYHCDTPTKIANNKTRRRFLPNLHNRKIWVESENRWVRLRISNDGLRLIDKHGIDKVLADLRASGTRI